MPHYSVMKPDKQIDYIEMPMKNAESTKKFYNRIFGWTFEDYGPDYISFHDGRISGGFTTLAKGPAQGTLVVFYSSNLEAMEQAIIAAGGTIVKPTFSFPGGRRFHFTDPSGNELAVWSDVGAS